MGTEEEIFRDRTEKKKKEKLEREEMKRSVQCGSICEEKHLAGTWEGGLAMGDCGFATDQGALESLLQPMFCLSNRGQVTSSLGKKRRPFFSKGTRSSRQ